MHNNIPDLNASAMLFSMVERRSFAPAVDSTIDVLGSMGYEAADPRLQVPLWVDCMHCKNNLQELR